MKQVVLKIELVFKSFCSMDLISIKAGSLKIELVLKSSA